MKYLSIYFILFNLTFIYNQVFSTPLTDRETVDTIWNPVHRIKFTNPNGIVGSDYKLIYKNLYITDDDYKLPGVNILAYNMITGKLEWEWRYNRTEYNHSRKIEMYKDKLIIDTGYGLICLHLPSQTIVWEVLHKDENYRDDNLMHVFGDYIYKALEKGNGKTVSSSTYFRWRIDTGEKESLFTLSRKDNTFGPTFTGPALYENPKSGDTLLITVNNWSGDPSPQRSPCDLLVYNLRTKKEEWKAEQFCKVGTGFDHKPLIYGNDVIIPGDWSIYSYNIITGKLNWRKEFPELGNFGCFNDTQLLLIDDYLYVNPYTDDVMCLKVDSGEILWRNSVFSYNSSPTMLYKDKMLIFTGFGNGSILIIDAKTGKLIHREYPHDNSSFTSNIVYDSELDLFGCQNFEYLYFFKINKPK